MMPTMHAPYPRYAILAFLVLCPLMTGLLFGPRAGWPGAVGGAIGGLVAWSILASLNRRRCSP